jgi:hypothetical protein
MNSRISLLNIFLFLGIPWGTGDGGGGSLFALTNFWIVFLRLSIRRHDADDTYWRATHSTAAGLGRPDAWERTSWVVILAA